MIVLLTCILKLFFRRYILGEFSEGVYNILCAFRIQKSDPYWMANRREKRNHGMLNWLVLPSQKFYDEIEHPYRPG